MKILAINLPNLDLSYFTSRGLNFEVEYKTLAGKFPVIQTRGGANPIYTPDVGSFLEQQYKIFQYSIILVGWLPQDYPGIPGTTGGYTHYNPLSCGTWWTTVRADWNAKAFYIHEINHSICYILNVNFGLNRSNATMVMDYMDSSKEGIPYLKNFEPDAPDGNHAQTWSSIKPHLSKLNGITYNTMPTYKYFKPSEIVGLKPELVVKLDQARGIAGVPFKITSGFRTAEHNTEVGGVEGSSHTSGLAVDLSVKDGVSGGKILLALAQVGFKRFGFYKDGHIHVDCDLTKPNPAYWVK